MKEPKILTIAFLVAMAGCSRAPQPTSTTRLSGSGDQINEIVVEQALFGSGTHLADVTARVIELLRSEPRGFTARADWLHVDPLPGKNKTLLIRYNLRGKERFFMVTGENRASYNALLADESDR